jgi:hypothetical protein
MQRTRLRSWQLTPREYWAQLALWMIGAVLIDHYLLGRSTLDWLIALVASAVVSYGIVVAARFIPVWHKHRL